MLIPFITPRNSSRRIKRAGGGGAGRGGGSSSSSSGSKGSSSSSGSKGSSSSSGSKGSSGSSGSSSSSGKGSCSSSGSKGSSSSSGSSISGTKGSTTSRSSTIYGSSHSITPYSNGATRQITIPSGSLFAGRTAGGATRSNIFGTRTYGSGYPGITGRGVAGRGFPYYFWPVVWGGSAGYAGAYLYDTEYGRPDNSSRPGGVQVTAIFISNSGPTVFRIVSDNTTVLDLISDIQANCSSHLASNSSSSASSVTAYNSSATNAPQPEQVVQYYRSSSVSLLLDGYNNTAIFQSEGTPDVALPSGIDTTLLECMNSTIGVAVPLVDSSSARLAAPCYGVVGLLWVMLYLGGIL